MIKIFVSNEDEKRMIKALLAEVSVRLDPTFVCEYLENADEEDEIALKNIGRKAIFDFIEDIYKVPVEIEAE